MNLPTARVAALACGLSAITCSGYAAAAPAGLIADDASATFAFTTSVRTPKGTKSGAGTVTMLPDDMRLTVTAELTDGNIRQIRGTQTDGIFVADKQVQIESSWSFTRLPN